MAISDLRSLLAATASSAAILLVTACSSGSLPSAGIPSGADAARTTSLARTPASSGSYQFITLDNQNDPTFNQLLGINTRGKIAGYFGSGASPSHPNKGYVLKKPYGQKDYTNENYPGSVQTQVTAINNDGDTAGFWVDAYMVNRGFVKWHGVFTSYADPKGKGGNFTQILGINDSGIAAGFYTDTSSVNHGFTLNQATGKFKPITPPGGGSVTASAINNLGDIVGFQTIGTGTTAQTAGWIKKNGKFSALQFPKGSNTQPFGVNDNDQIVGSYLDGNGVMHGFLVSTPLTHAKWVSIDDPNGVGTTTINGLNNAGDMVGFYTDTANNVDGMLILP
jgi:hypothetical protein